MSDLRKKLIRLAHSKPELRKDLLPLLKTKTAGGRPTRLKSIRQIQKLTGPITMVQSESSTSPQGDFWFTDGYDALYAYAPKNSREFEGLVQMFSD